MIYTIPLLKLSKNDNPTAGGKGANLGELAAAGFPIPAGFVLTTAAYDAVVNENNLRLQIVELANKAAVNDPQVSEEASEKIKQLFLTREIAGEIETELYSAYEAMDQVAVAVRSSATAEDLPQASFAGQQETFLNVRGWEALLEAVKACWASLWTARAIAYRQQMDIAHEDVSMAVVVQVLVPAEVSGILFTANPTSGERDEMVVNASYGMGEAIVSGQVTPDSYLLDRQNKKVVETAVGTKETMIVATDEQPVISRPVPADLQNQPALNAGQLAELVDLGAKVEAHFDTVPQDIEWVFLQGQCWLLQARPITKLPPAPLRDVRWNPPRPGTIWMRRQVVEHMPEPLSPLFDELYLQEGLDLSMQNMADYMSEISGVRFNVWEIIDPPFATTVNGYAYSIASFDISPRLIPLVLRVYVTVLPKMIRHLVPRWKDESLPGYRATIADWKRVELDGAHDEELLRGVRELALADAAYWFDSAVALGMARITDSALNGYLKVVVGRRGWAREINLTSGSYLRGFPSITIDAQSQIEVIAREIESSEDLREKVLDTAAQKLPAVLAEHPAGKKALDGFERYLDTYGHQIYDLDFAAPTLADDPLPVLLSLKSAVAHPERDANARLAEMAQERSALEARTKQALDPVRGWIFQLLLGWAQRYSPYREEALFYVGAAWPALRRMAHELGRRLVEAGSLEDKDDVFFLRSDELAAASAARTAGESRPELAQLARDRRLLREARKRLDPPVVVPADGRMKFGPIDLAMFEPKSRSISTGPMLEGFAVSPGQVTAPASVIHAPDEFGQMAPDTVLVCKTTTPAWTPLFAQAKGLVTDIGGALAHGSIVAREYGIPAVMGTGAATQRIESGQLIRVDGDSGTVTLVDEGGADDDGMMRVDQAAEQAAAAARKRKTLLTLAAGIAVILLVWWRRRRR